MPKGPRREPAAPKRSRRTGSGAGAGVLRNAPGTGRMGVVAAILSRGYGQALTPETEGLFGRVSNVSRARVGWSERVARRNVERGLKQRQKQEKC